MLIEAFVNLVNARGIDFTHVAGSASRIDGAARPRRLSRAEMKIRRELHLALHVEPTARGAGSRVSRAPVYSHAELAHAMAGVPRMPELALYFSLAGWLGGFEELHRGLMRKQLNAMDQDWPMIVQYSGGKAGEPYDYVPKLATLVLIADAHKQSFLDATGLHGNWTPWDLIGMDEPAWKRHLATRYIDLKHQYECWYTEALRIIRKRMLPGEPVDEDERQLATA
jgi:hypothetical protein